METLAIVAYHQPITRAEIEEVRGVSLSKGTLDTLLEAGWVKPKGRRRTPGRPVTWATSQTFLDHFGLSAIDDLPGWPSSRQPAARCPPGHDDTGRTRTFAELR